MGTPAYKVICVAASPFLREELRQPERLALEALRKLNAHDQLELACRNLLGVLIAARTRFESSRDDQDSINAPCDALEEWVQSEIAALRFAGTHSTPPIIDTHRILLVGPTREVEE